MQVRLGLDLAWWRRSSLMADHAHRCSGSVYLISKDAAADLTNDVVLDQFPKKVVDFWGLHMLTVSNFLSDQRWQARLTISSG